MWLQNHILNLSVSKNQITLCPKDDWIDMPKQAISYSNSYRFGIDKYPENQKRMWSGYLATVTYMDEQVGRILNCLKELELEKETAIIFTSDHGYLPRTSFLAKKGI